MTSAPSSEGASTPEESYAETTPLASGRPRRQARGPKKARARKGKAEGQWALGYREPHEQERAVQEGRPPAQRPGAHREHLRPPRLRLDRPGRPARALPVDGPLHPARRGLPGHRHRPRRRGVPRRPSTSCCGSASTAARSRPSSCASSARSPRRSPATPPTSPTARTSSCTGSASRTSRRSGAGSRPWASTTTEACGDCPRVVLGSPVAGSAPTRSSTARPPIDEIVERFLGDRSLANLPRKFKTAISGQQDVAHEVNDVSFVGVVHPEHGPGFDIHVGGGLSTNPKLAVRLGAWVPLDEVADVWHGVVQVFRDYGYRRLRTRARLKFLIADWGPEKFRQVLEDEYLQPQARRRPGARPGRRDHRPRRRPRPGRRQEVRRRRPARGPDLRLHAGRRREGRRGRRVDAGPPHAVPEDPRARRPRRAARAP